MGNTGSGQPKRYDSVSNLRNLVIDDRDITMEMQDMFSRLGITLTKYVPKEDEEKKNTKHRLQMVLPDHLHLFDGTSITDGTYLLTSQRMILLTQQHTYGKIKLMANGARLACVKLNKMGQFQFTVEARIKKLFCDYFGWSLGEWPSRLNVTKEQKNKVYETFKRVSTKYGLDVYLNAAPHRWWEIGDDTEGLSIPLYDYTDVKKDDMPERASDTETLPLILTYGINEAMLSAITHGESRNGWGYWTVEWDISVCDEV